VQQALEVDLRLGARLAGEVKPVFQQQTVHLVEDLLVPSRLKVELLEVGRSEFSIPGLLKAIEDSDSYVRSSAAEALGKLGSEAAIPALLKAIEHSDSDVRRRAADALGQLGSEAAIPALLKAIEDSDFDVRWSAAYALDTLAKNHAQALSSHLPHLLTLIPTAAGQQADRVILAIQTNCKFYNYEVWQAHRAAQKRDRPNGQERDRLNSQECDRPNGQERDRPNNTIYNIDRVGNLNTSTVNIQGNQVGNQPQANAEEAE
jgi:hypothetical protein